MHENRGTKTWLKIFVIWSVFSEIFAYLWIDNYQVQFKCKEQQQRHNIDVVCSYPRHYFPPTLIYPSRIMKIHVTADFSYKNEQYFSDVEGCLVLII